MLNIVLQTWGESERGWGVRPDGISIHSDNKECKEYITSYWNSMPNGVQDEYSFPSGNPVLISIDNQSLEDKLNSMGFPLDVKSLRFFEHSDLISKIITN